MLPKRYTDLGFAITKFDANSKVLKFHQTPVFVFNRQNSIDDGFLIRICDTYLKISSNTKNLIGIRVGNY